MKLILAPAKNMRSVTSCTISPCPPPFLKDAARLAEDLRSRSAWELEGLLKTNRDIAWQAFADYQAFDARLPGSPALLAYSGLCYRHLSPESFSSADLAFAQGRLYILSALYGLLGPMDGILPHRLELQIPYRYEGRSLYRYWGGRICRALFSEKEPAVNLASAEYARLVSPFLQKEDALISVCFCSVRRGKRTVIPTFAKMARGAMARFIIQNRIDDPRRLWDFQELGYLFAPALSDERQYVFLRQEA